MDNFYIDKELENLGLKSHGKNVLISKKCSIYGSENISIGNNVRIDDFCILSGKIRIGNNVHIAANTRLVAGEAGICIEDFGEISSNCSIYAISDDYTGNYLIGPCIPKDFRNIIKKPVYIKKHAAIGASSVIMPGSIIEEGVAIWTMSLIKQKTKPWKIYFGIPAKMIGEREKNLLKLEEKLKRGEKNG